MWSNREERANQSQRQEHEGDDGEVYRRAARIHLGTQETDDVP